MTEKFKHDFGTIGIQEEEEIVTNWRILESDGVASFLPILLQREWEIDVKMKLIPAWKNRERGISRLNLVSAPLLLLLTDHVFASRP